MPKSFIIIASLASIGLLSPWVLSQGLAGSEGANQNGHGHSGVYEVVFEPVNARFFRLVAYSEAQGSDRVAHIEDLQILKASDGEVIERGDWSVAGASNKFAAESQPGIQAFDEVPGTRWASAGEPPHHLDIDLQRPEDLAGFRYRPTPDEAGAIHEFAVFLSQNGVDWGDPVIRGSLVQRSGAEGDSTGQNPPPPIELERYTFAPPGMVNGPVAIDVDERNRVYVAETYRYMGRGVIDNRGKKLREAEDLQINTLEDRRVTFTRWLESGELSGELGMHAELFASDGSDFFTKFSEKVALLEDQDGDGRADRRRVVAQGFAGMLVGPAAGVLVRGHSLYLACIPALWFLEDTDGDDQLNERVALSRGYGVRAGWFGHDLHGLTWGPDGRLYYTVADRGYNVRTDKRQVLHGPDTGAVFRCWPDGSGLELVATGLRNPQELAFNDLGYLFTGDNNCDAGDRARLVQVVEGGDSGWRVSVQSLADRGPWLSEAMWELPRKDGEEALQPSWILPPLAYLNSGPSGMAAYPGTGLPESYRGFFFLCDYRGGRGSIQSFRVEPKGASFAMSGHHTFHEGPTVSDLCFGYDGKAYVAEWGPGWDISPYARIYTLAHAPTVGTDAVREVRSWFQQGFERFNASELRQQLAHADRRVRYEAQRQLVQRGEHDVLRQELADGKDQLARLHSIWGLGQLAVADPEILESFVPHLNDPDPEVRGRLLRVCAEHGFAPAGPAAKEALAAVNHPRLRFHAAYAVGRLKPEGALEALLELVQANHEEDAYLRHACVMGLESLNEVDLLIERALSSSSEAVRLAAVLVLRRQVDARVGQFLQDDSWRVATEAARAIYDREIKGAMEALAAHLEAVSDQEAVPEPLLQRSVEANFQLGSSVAAERLCRFVQSKHQPKTMRALALERLLMWDTPPNREGVWGRWRPQMRAEAGLAKSPVRTFLQDLLESEDRELQALAQRLDALYGKEKTPAQLAAMVQSESTTESLRIDALLALEKVREAQGELYEQACQSAMIAPESASLRAAALQSWARVQGDAARGEIERAVESGVTALEKQAGVRSAATLSSGIFQELMNQWMTALSDGRLDPLIQLEVFELAENSEDAALREQTGAYREMAGAMGIHRLSLKGGDPVTGQELYETNLAAQCMRCHALRGKGGDAGPPLDGLARRRSDEEILKSVVDPQADVVPGYGLQNITLRSGELVAGTLVSEDEQTVVISEEGRIRRVPVVEIAQRSPEVSGMPPAGLVLKPRELRDLLAFLQTLN